MPFDGIVTRAATEQLKEVVLPGKINKIYQPTPTDLVLTIRSQRKNQNLLLSIHPTYARFHLTDDKYTNPQEPPMFCMVLRKHLTGATIQSIEQNGLERIVTIHVESMNEIGDVKSKALIIELMGKHSNIILIDTEKNIIIDSMKHVSPAQNRYRTILPGYEYILPPEQDKHNPLTIDPKEFSSLLDFNAGQLDKQIVHILEGFSPFIAKEICERAHLGGHKEYEEAFKYIQTEINNNAWSPAIYKNSREDFHVLNISYFDGEEQSHHSTFEMLDTFYSGKAERDRVRQQAKDLYRFIKNEKDKNERKLKKQEQTFKKAAQADKYQKEGELLTAHMHEIKQGDTQITVIDYYDPEQSKLTIQLDPQKTPSQNAQNLFKTYQKLKTSREMMQIEITKTNAEIHYLDHLLQQIEDAREEDVVEIREELIEEGYMRKRKTTQKQKAQKPTPETFTASDGTTIYVGKNNKQNDYLTTKLAHKNDIWLHTKDIPGSHVVIKSAEPSEDTLLEAAILAAYYSKSKDSSSVPVDFTKVRHVKKPNGAKPGFVTYDQQKTLFVTPEINLIAKLKNSKA